MSQALSLTRKNKQWVKIKTTFDGVEAWVDVRQLAYITEAQFTRFNQKYAVALEVCQVLINNDLSFPVMIASTLPEYDGMVFKTADTKYVYNGQANPFNANTFTPEMIEKIARRFVNAPFIQGGRSVFGIDRVALVQLIYKCAGLSLPGTLPEMYKLDCQAIHFVELAQPGDVVYCVNKNDELDHIGIFLSDSNILHVEEKARIDKLDHEGIYNREAKKYTHRLKLIARYITR
ncbi:MAG: C40 family peptidase [Saprospiraceae bacterium]|nr:C40 family peptidase [Saprospiraceae bacterium]